MKRLLLGIAGFCGLTTVCLADMDEEGFEFYEEGELLSQKAWWVQAPSSETGGYSNTAERMEIRRDAKTKGQWIVWKAGFGGKQQTRLVKRFPATMGTKVVVSFDFKPGDENVGGRLHFDQPDVGATALQFSGTIHILEAGKKETTDTGVKFQPDAWNHFQLRLDFEKHGVEVFLDQKSLGAYELPADMTQLSQINFFGGGAAFESALDNLLIQSVDNFSEAAVTSPIK